jgi:hypothetical protein
MSAVRVIIKIQVLMNKPPTPTAKERDEQQRESEELD